MLNNKSRLFLLLTLTFIIAMGLSVATAADIDNDATDIPVIEDTSAAGVADSVVACDVSVKDNKLDKKTVEYTKSEGTSELTDATWTDFFDDNGNMKEDVVSSGSELKFNGKFSDRTMNLTVASSIVSGSSQAVFEGCTFTVSNDVTMKNIEATGTRVVVSSGKTLNMINCSFADFSDNVRVFDVSSGASVYVNDSSFTDIGNWGVFYFSSNSKADFNRSTFSGCSNAAGGAIAINGRGTFNIDNCTFTDNTASLRGGAIYSKGTLTVSNCVFNGNSVTATGLNKNQGGSVMFVEGNLYLYNNTMTGNTGLTADIYNSYATIYTPVNIVIDDVECEEGSEVDLTAKITDADGNTIDLIVNATGIVGLDNNVDYLSFFNLTVENSKYNVTRTQSLKGIVTRSIAPELAPGNYTIGAEVWEDEFANVNITTGTLSIVEAPSCSYAKLQNLIDESSDDIVLDIDVVRGATETTVVFNKSVTVDFNGLTWDANQGQAIEVVNGATATIKNAVIVNVNNTSPSYTNYYGRLARITSGNLVLENVTITNCSAPNYYTSGKGNLIRLSTGAGLTMTDCTVEAIQGRLVIDNGPGAIVISDCRIVNNNLGSEFDSIIEPKGTLTITGTEFSNNNAHQAIIYGIAQDYAMTLNNVSFINNTVNVGGTVYTRDTTTVSNSLFLNNKATRSTGKSGAIASFGPLTVFNSTFIGNDNPNDGTVIYQGGYSGSNSLNVSHSVIVPVSTGKAAIYNGVEDSITATANYNYWGSNDDPAGYVLSGTYEEEDEYGWDTEIYDCTPIDVSYWVIMNSTVSPEDVSVYDDVTVEVSYNKYTDGNDIYDMDGSIPDMEVSFEASEGTVTPQNTVTSAGVATAVYTVESETVTVTVSDSYVTNIHNINAQSSKPEVIILNDGNWTEYFANDGLIKNTVIPGSELRFDGAFQDRYMVINIPVNITTADNKAQLNNCTITLLTDNVNITDIEMISDDNEEGLIVLENASNVRIEDNKLTITNNDNEVQTNSIIITGGSDIVIRRNMITTTGPENNIVYGTNDRIVTIYTSSISAQANNLIIDGNVIKTTNNDADPDNQGTIYGIYIYGDSEDKTVDNLQIINNEIITEGKVYDYGVKVHWADNALIENNTLTGTSDRFISGIHPFVCTNTLINNNKIDNRATNMGYAIVLEGAMDLETYEVHSPHDTNVTNNNVNVEANYVWAIELYAGEDNIVNYNNITVIADNGIGIGIADQNSEASYNNIEVTATMQLPITDSFDYIEPYTTGIRIANNGLKKVDLNTVTYNNITVTANNNVPAVNSSTDHSTVTDNYLVSPAGIGDLAVVDTGKGGIVANNSPKMIITDETYDFFFDEQSVLKTTFNNTDLKVSGDITGKVFIFDGVNVTIANDGTATLYESQIWTGNGATVMFDGIVIENSFDAIVFESAGNVLNNSVITITSEDEVHAITVYDDLNTIANTVVTVTAPAGDVQYNSDYSTKAQAPTAIVVSGSDILLDNVTVTFNSDSALEDSYYPTMNGIHIGSVSGAIENTVVRDSKVSVNGKNYAYGINVGNAKNTTLDNVDVSVSSEYYADAIQLFDADGITISGSVNAEADTQAYGIYSTAMGTGASQNIDLTGLDVTVTAADATGALFEGSSNILIADADYTITGDKATAVNAHVDWMGNNPTNVTITGLDVNIDTTGEANILYFGNASDITVTDNHIEATGGSEINFNATPNSAVTDNYILIKDMFEGTFGNYAVVTTEDDTVVENNTPTSKVVEDLEKQLEELQQQLDELNGAKNTTIILDEVTDAKYNANVTISGILINEDSISLSNQIVTLTIGDKTVDLTTRNGEFSYTTIIKSMDDQTVVASYAGSDKYRESEATMTFSMNKQDVVVTFDPIGDVKYGENVTITGKFTDSEGKAISNSNVKVTIDGKKYYARTDKTGAFTLSAKATDVGENEVTIGYSGNDKYNAYEETATFNVEKQDVIVTYETIVDTAKGDNVTITGTFTDANGKAIANSNVKITINGKKYYAKTDANGVYTLSVQVTQAGENTVTIGYSGNDKYNAYEETTTFNADKQNVVVTYDAISEVSVGDNVTITGTFTDSNGKAVINSNVKITIDGKKYYAKTDSTGAYVLSVEMTKAGEKTVTIGYSGNANYNEYSTETTFTVLEKA